MSRRKQSNPKSVSSAADEGLEGVAKQPEQYLLDNNQESEEEVFRPLIIDTAEETDQSEIVKNSELSFPDGPVPKPTMTRGSTPFSPREGPITMETEYGSGSLSSNESRTSHGCYGDSIYEAAQTSSEGSNRGKGSAPSKTRRKGDRIMPVASELGEEKFMCPICKQTLLSQTDLTRHIRSHNTTTTASNSCTICGKVLSSQSSLDRHMLVHSGERPFECRVCKMSFTTNGNMHRHMRIHEKEVLGVAPGFLGNPQKEAFNMAVRRYKPRKGSDSTVFDTRGDEPSQRQDESEAIAALRQELDHASPKPEVSKFDVGSGTQAKLEDSQSNVQEGPVLSDRTLPYKHDNGEQDRINSQPKRKFDHEEQSHTADLPRKRLAVTMTTNTMGLKNTPMMCTVEPLSIISPYKRMLSEKAAAAEGLQSLLECSVCSDRFHCCYGLEVHMAMVHADLGNVCGECYMVFHSPRGLQVHQVMVHRRKESTSLQAPNSPSPVVPVGFHPLDYVDFSSEKFTEISRAWCEKNQRRPSSYLHDFTCRKCDHAFPTRGAFQMHQESHPPEKTSTCSTCDCTFGAVKDYKGHMAQHAGRQVVESYSFLSSADDNDLQDCVSQPEFMLVLGLQSTAFGKAVSKQSNPVKVRQDLKLNVDYYHRVVEGRKVKNEIASPSIKSHQAVSGKALLEQLQAPISLGFAESRSSYGRTENVTNHSGINHGNRTPGWVDSQQEHIENDLRVSDEDSNNSAEEINCDQTDKTTSESLHPCKFCDETFPTYKSMKGHERYHLGLSPYQCKLCTYSSTDKSTLIRHLRTHNGERPFQCLVCDFAFTTKANCERHVRKRHSRSNKMDIEASIGYNQYTSDKSPDVEAFTSPDTICKYCGEDFKFFRALKHHLRSHTSCRRKPFVCKICFIGFSTKANCVRHVQKQHTDLSQSDVENHIQVNEVLDEDPAETQELFSSTPCGSTPQPHSLLKESPILVPAPVMHGHRGNLMTSPFPFFTTPPMPVVKHEREDLGFEQPLDFSLKKRTSPQQDCSILDMSRRRTVSTSSVQEQAVGAQDSPIDLTVKKRTSDVGLTPSTAHTVIGSHLARSSFGQDRGVMLRSIEPRPPGLLTPHTILNQPNRYLGLHKRMLRPTSQSRIDNRPLPCGYCMDTFETKFNLEKHIRSRHSKMPFESLKSQQTESKQIHPAFLKYSRLAAASASFLPQKETNNNIPKLTEVDFKSSMSSAYSSDSELTSVTRILDATDPMRFQGFLQEQIRTPPTPKDKVTPRNVPLVGSQSFGFRSTIKAEVDISRSNNPQTSTSHPSITPINDDSGNPASDVPGRPLPLLDTLSPSEDLDSDTAHSPSGEGKRKRNSYADSPHKLRCPYCPRAFPWISSLKRHILTHTGQKPYKCPQCPVTFSTKSNRERHMIRKHGLNVHDPETRQMMDRPYKCHLCVFSSFSSAGNLLKHYKDRHPEREMSVSSNNGSEDTGFTDNLSTSDLSNPPSNLVDFEDEEEDEIYLQEIMDRKLFAYSKDSSPRGDSPTPTTASNPALTPRSTPRATPTPAHHQTTIHQIRLPESTPDRHVNPERDNYNVDKITDCWKCGLAFDSRKSLLRHLKEHNVDCPFKCYLCDASFDTRMESLQHKMSRHPTDYATIKEKNKIADCGQFVATQDALVQEALAGKVTSRSGLELGEDFKQESDYAQRKVYCSLCIKRFWSLQDLRRHMRSHTGERPFECDICQARFTLKHSMMRHRRKHCEPDAVPSDDDSVMTTDDANDQLFSQRLIQTPSPHPSNYGNHRQQQPRQPISQTSGKMSIGGDLLKSDLLHNLLGVEPAAIDQMLDSVDNAKQLLGVRPQSNRP